MTNDNNNDEILVKHGLSGSVLECQPWINSEKLKGRISRTQFLNVIDLQHMLLNMCSSRW